MPKDLIECERCENRWASEAVGRKVTCTFCGYKTERNVVGKEVFLRGKGMYHGSEDIDDLVEATERRLKEIQSLREEGYEISKTEAVKDDYIYLWKIEEGEE